MFKYILVCLLLSSAALAQAPTSPGLLTSVITNDTVTGTIVNKLAKLTAGKAIITATTDTDGAIGVVLSAAGLGGSAQIVTNGVVSCVFDGTATAGNYVQISNSVAGDCRDSGSTTRPIGVQAIGRVIAGGSGVGTYIILLQPMGTNLNGTASGLIAGGVVANGVTRAMEAQGIARSVIGVTGNATANVADIQGAANQALVVNPGGTALAFGQVNLGAPAAVTGVLGTGNGGTNDTGSAWTPFTPSEQCNSAAGTWTTNSARSKALGKTIFVEIDFTITAIGTCATSAFNFTLPFTSNSAGGMAGRETAVAGTPISCAVPTGSPTMQCFLTTGNIAVNERFVASGVYESQ